MVKYSHTIREYSSLEIPMHYATWMRPGGVMPVTKRKNAFTFNKVPAGVKIVATLGRVAAARGSENVEWKDSI